MSARHMVLPVLAAAATLAAVPAHASCANWAVPDAGRIVIVSNDMQINGVPMSVRELHSKKSPDEIARFYRGDWEGRRQRVQEITEGGWRTLSTLAGDCFYTVQIKPGPNQGTYALLGLTQLSNGPVQSRGEGFPKLAGSQVYNDIKSNDSGKMGRVLLFKNSSSPRTNAEFYRNTLRTQGWVSVSDQATETLEGMQYLQIWRRGVEEIHLTMTTGQGETQVVVNTVDRP